MFPVVHNKLEKFDHFKDNFSVLFEGRRAEAELQSEYPAAESLVSAAAAASPLSSENPTAGESEEEESEEQSETFLKEEERASGEDSAGERISSPTQPTCLTVQPSRVHCGVRMKK